MSRRLASLVLSVVCAVPIYSHAQQSVPVPDTSLEAAVFDNLSTHIRFEGDGTSVEESTSVIRVQSEAAVQQLGQLVFGYNSETEALRIDYVRVRKPNGTTTETPATNVQDLALAVFSWAPMYSDFRQKHVTVVALRPGDTLEYRVIHETKTPLTPGHFFYEHSFPKDAAVTQASLEVDVPKGRELRLKSPSYKFDVRETSDRRVYTWLVRNVTPKRDRKAEEEEESSVGPDVQLTTFTDWKDIARWYAQLQRQQMVVDATVRKQAEELTRGAATPMEKARRLYDFVSRDFRYVSLSFGVGRFQPHPAPEVLHNGYGDCKDKHTLLATLLSAAGIESYPVLIHHDRKLDAEVPSPAQFDHVITAARIGNGLVWLDSTPEVAPFALISYPLRNKQALLASQDERAGLVKTPADAPMKGLLSTSIDGKVAETGAVDVVMEVKAVGDSELPLRSAFRQTSQADWKRLVQFVSAFGPGGEVSDLDVGSLDDTSKPFHLRYRYRQGQYFRVPSSNVAFIPLAPISFGQLRYKKKGNEPLDIGPVGEVVQRIRLEFPDNYTIHIPATITMKRDYGEYSLTYVMAKNVLTAERRFAVHANELPAARRSDLESFVNVLTSAAEQTVSATITAPSRSALASASKIEGKPDELHKQGIAAFGPRDFKSAADLLKRVVEQEPDNRDAWDELGRAYLGLHDRDQAIAAFRKQIEVNSYHPRAYDDLGAALQEAGHLDEAVAAYRKQLDMKPEDNRARRSLVLLLAQLKRDKEARAELDSISPDQLGNPAMQFALARIYARTGDPAKGRSMMSSLIGSTASTAGSDVFNAALGDDVDPARSETEAQHVLDEIGNLFDSGDFDEMGSDAFSAMHFVALSWARVGWAKFLATKAPQAPRYLESAWLLSRSGPVADRISRYYETARLPDKARHMAALAVAVGGTGTDVSRARLEKLTGGAAAAEREVASARSELAQMWTVKLPGVAARNVSADFNLLFDGSSKPQLTEFVSGDGVLRDADKQIRAAEYPVWFPDYSSVKIVRRAVVACGATNCSITLAPLDKVQAPVWREPATATDAH